MKKLYILLIVLGFAQGFGQTYTMEVSYSIPVVKFCYDGSYGWGVTGFTEETYSKTRQPSFSSNNINENVPNYNTFVIAVTSTCRDRNGSSTCDGSYSQNIPASQLIKSGSWQVDGCWEFLSLDYFKPNLTIQKATPLVTEVCSGELLDLVGLPSGFPKEAYHWQYSLDNQVTWADVSAGFNDNANGLSNFTIKDILGVNHENYFGKQIYFRLGYDQNRPFTTPIAINYSACAPVIKDRKYVGPDCSGDQVKSVEVYFEKPLELNEDLYPMQIIPFPKAAGDVAKFSQNPVTQLILEPSTGWYKYSFIIPANEQLENNKNYTIEYQARKNSVPQGVLTSSNPFLYTEPTPLRFTTKENQALCNGGDGSIEVLVWGGSGNYTYELDGVAVTTFLFAPEIYIDPLDSISKQRAVIKANSTPNPNPNISTNHSIKVTDGKGCFDKTY
jgi:SprB repeat